MEKLKQNADTLCESSTTSLNQAFLSTMDAAIAADDFRQDITEDKIDLIADFVFKLLDPTKLMLEKNPIFEAIIKELMLPIEEISTDAIKEIFDPSAKYSFYDIFLDDVHGAAVDKKNRILNARDEFVSSMASINLTPSEIRQYQKDLRERRYANQMLTGFFNGQAGLVHLFDEIKLIDESSWSLIIGERLYKACITPLTLNPLVGLVSFALDLYTDFSRLGSDGQMFLLSMYTLKRSCFAESQDPFENVFEAISHNTIQGLENIQSKIAPQIVEGRINVPQALTGNTYKVEIENTGSKTAEYKLLYTFYKTYCSYELLPTVGRYYDLPENAVYPNNKDWLEIEPGGKITFDIEIPKESPLVNLNLLGKSGTGIYGLDSKTTTREQDHWYSQAKSWIKSIIKSPGELRVCDSQGRVTGLVEGEAVVEIPDSAYDRENKLVVISSSSPCPYEFSSYNCIVKGTAVGTYTVEITTFMNGETSTFVANSIPTSPSVTHQYTVDWDALSVGEEGVTVQVDSDGDGEPEHTFTSGSELTHFPGDVSMDGQVNILDVVVAANAFGSRTGEDRWNQAADENLDGRINVLDLILIAREFGKRYV
jgi:hypothetical protein